jgi:hypothetical protein
LIKRRGDERCPDRRRNEHPIGPPTKRVFQREMKRLLLPVTSNVISLHMLLHRRAHHFFISARGNEQRRRTKAKSAFHFAFECFVDHRRLTS